MRLALWLFASGCAVVRGNGVQVEESREVSEFSAVENAISVWVEAADGEPSVTVRCDENLIDLIETEVRGGALRVSNQLITGLAPRADCGVIVTTPGLSGITTSGSGSIRAMGDLPDLSWVSSIGSGEAIADGVLSGLDDAYNTGSGGITLHGIAVDAIRLQSSGSGAIHADGSAIEANLDASGSGGIFASGLVTESALVNASGSGRVELTVTGEASVSLSGSGSVHLWGDPALDPYDTGSGQIVLE